MGTIGLSEHIVCDEFEFINEGVGKILAIKETVSPIHPDVVA